MAKITVTRCLSTPCGKCELNKSNNNVLHLHFWCNIKCFFFFMIKHQNYYYYLIYGKYNNPNFRTVKRIFDSDILLYFRTPFFAFNSEIQRHTKTIFPYCIDLAHFPPIVSTDFLYGRQTGPKVKMGHVKFDHFNTPFVCANTAILSTFLLYVQTRTIGSC